MTVYTAMVLHNLMALACFLAAAYLILLGITGWGWIIFAGMCFMRFESSKE